MKRLILCALGFWTLVQAPGAEPLRFFYQVGDQYRYYGTSTQTITVNREFLQQNLLSYRIAFSVVEADPSGTGRLQGHITYLTQRQGGVGSIDQEYDTDYRVDSRGIYQVPAAQVMPVVRHVPTFPEGDIAPGETWTAPGEEVHDLQKDFGVDQLLRIPFDVHYTYQGPVVRDGVTLQAIRSEYTLYKRTGFRYPKLKLYPLLMTGYSRQIHYFNAEKGREEGYEEEYSLVLTMNTGEVVEYSGRGESHLIEAQTMNKPAMVEEVRRELEDRGMGGVEVRAVPLGVSINLDNIRFPPDSAQLVASEREKIRLIAEVLQLYSDRDILVEGHTADVRGGADPQTLSEDRAAAVGNALIAAGVRVPGQIVYRGWGAQRPLAPNDTEAGRALNRRVEITVLEN